MMEIEGGVGLTGEKNVMCAQRSETMLVRETVIGIETRN
jgi:hypothetical protein